jgi:DNA-binding NarL/FixJ family response regulator
VDIVGRDEELRAIESFVGAQGDSGVALLFDGEAGIGKSTIWQEGLRLARDRGFGVLVARPAESESALPYVALADIVEPLLPLGRALQPAHAWALESVMSAGTANELTVSRAMLALVRARADEGTVVLAVDDVQWLDPPSNSVLRFVLRRVGDLPVRILIARRVDEFAPVPLGLDRAFGERLVVLRVGPLSLVDLDRLLANRLGLRLARPRLERLHRACHGNPLYALEVGRSLVNADADDDSLPLPPQLAGLLETRIRALQPQARDAALLASACLQPTVSLVERAAGGHLGVADAISQEVLRIERDRLRFTHPLLAEATYAAAAPWERRDAHARLAAEAESTVERAHHLARSVQRPDDSVAAELERAATEAASRGVPATAAELAGHAARLSTDEATRTNRSVAAAEYRLVSGDPEGARAALERIAAELPPGGTRARVLTVIAELASTSDPQAALRLQLEALAEASAEPARAAEIHLALSTTTWNLGRLAESTAHTRAAVALAEQSGEDALLAMGLGELLHCEMMLGLPLSETAAARALQLERSLEQLPSGTYFRPSISLAIVYTAVDRPEDARPLFEAELARLDAIGDEAIHWGVLSRLADLELRVGNLGEAVRLSRDALDSVRLLDHPGVERWALVPHAAALSQVGQLESAWEMASDALAQSEQGVSRITALRSLGTLGFCALSDDRYEEAWTTLAPAVDELQAIDIGELSIFGVAQNAIEALVALDQLDKATELVTWVEGRGRPAGRSWHRAVAARGRAIVSAAQGHEAAAQSALAEALAAHADLPQPFELARTLLMQGRIERRAKRRAAAREALTQALELFDRLGAGRWAEKAAAELARIPGRSPRTTELSETERRVAELVADGLSNKQVAASLFVTVRAVEANLSKVYAKLGVRSRTELASRLRGASR